MRSSPRRCSDNDSEPTPADPSLQRLLDSMYSAVISRESWVPLNSWPDESHTYQVAPSETPSPRAVEDMYRRLVGASRYHPVLSVLLDTAHPNYLELARQGIRRACRQLRPAYDPTDLSL